MNRRTPKERALNSQLELAITCLQASNFKDAKTLCQQVLTANPFDPDAHDILGIIATQSGNPTTGLKSIEKAIEIDATVAEFHVHQALALKALDRRDEARRAYERAIDCDSRFPEAFYNLAILLREDGEDELALTYNKKAVKLDPNNPRAHNNLGANFHELGHFEEAAKACQRAIKLAPEYRNAYLNVAASLAESDQIDQALEHCAAALLRWPDDADILNLQANALTRLNKLDDALLSLERAIVISPDHGQAHYAKGMALLCKGEYFLGWQEYEWRNRRPGYWPQRHYDAPRWDGTPLENKTLLVHWEQGFGDIIQFARYINRLAQTIGEEPQHDSARIIFDCPNKLIGLFESSFENIEIGDHGDSPPPFDFYVPLMSLAGILGTTAQSIPSDTPYIKNELLEYHRIPAAAENGLNVGIAWASEHGAMYRRKICDIKKLSRLFKIKGCHFYGLQFGEDSHQLKRYEKAENVTNLGEVLGDFAHTAAIVDQMDLIISIDTYLVHLAGAMNIPTWVMLPFSADWRWQLDRTDSPWYPSLRLFRQPQPGDWDALIAEIGASLENRTG